jgi:hypothetical protein
MNRRSAFRIFTILLLLVSAVTAYMNVFSEDAALRARANQLARTTAGCGDKCRLTNARIDRGMFDETFQYDIEGPGAGHYVVVCRRAYVAVGEHACTVTK